MWTQKRVQGDVTHLVRQLLASKRHQSAVSTCYHLLLHVQHGFSAEGYRLARYIGRHVYMRTDWGCLCRVGEGCSAGLIRSKSP